MPDRLASYIAGVMGLDVTVEKGTPENFATKKLVDHFHKMPRLLVLDNCEHVVQAAANLVRYLLDECKPLRVLVTSRCSLDLLSAEEVIPLQPLPYPQQATPKESAIRTESVQLFLQQANIRDQDERQKNGRFMAKVRELAELLQGIPQCLVLAAARYKTTLDLDAILHDALNALAVEHGAGDAKEKAVRESIKWSERLLSPTALRLFHRLSVFYGGWDDAAMSAVCFDKTVEPDVRVDYEFIAAQQELERLFLILADGDRHRMNHVVRLYADQALQMSGQAEHTVRVHAEFFTAVADQDGETLTKRNMRQSMLILSKESENISRAFSWCTRHNAQLGLQLAGALWQYWVVRGEYSHGRAKLDEFLAASVETSPFRLRALVGSAALAYFQSDYPTALSTAKECIDLAVRTQDIVVHLIALVVASVTTSFQQGGHSPSKPAMWRVWLNYCDESTLLADAPGGTAWMKALAHSNRALLIAYHSGNACKGWQDLLNEARYAVVNSQRAGNEWIFNVATVNEALTIWRCHPNPPQVKVEGLLKEAVQSRYTTGDRYGLLQIFGLVAAVISMSPKARIIDVMRAAILLGAQEGMQDQKELPIPALNTKLIKDARSICRAQLSPRMFQNLRDYGSKMYSQDAVHFALGELKLDLEDIANR
jgi:predicted ATPase